MSAKPQQCAVEFEMDGERYGIKMPAESWADAEKRMAAIRLTGKVVGFPCYSVKMPSPLAYVAMPFLPVITGLLNLFYRGKRP